MMYQVLARKWRPKNFHQLVGQTHVAQALTYALDHNRIHHAYLFTGTRGVGKTTIARIFAKSLNCLTKNISSEPCGDCQHCLEIDEGRFPDLIEVDAASRTGVDDTRELLDNVPYAPVKGRFKVYLIDEVHMFSRSSFNALLKTLEEPPAHVKFILATTDPQKLPATILSRCLQFHLKNMTEGQIAGHLQNILEREQADFETEALHLLANAAAGSMRDSLSLLDQALAYGQGKITVTDVSTLLGAVSSQQLFYLLEAIACGRGQDLRRILLQLDQYAPDYAALLQNILQIFQQITIVQLGADIPEDNISPALRAMAEQLPIELIQLWYQIATEAWQNLPYQPDSRLALEMTLLRMMALQPAHPLLQEKNIRAVPSGNTLSEPENGSGRANSPPESESENGSGRANSPPESESEKGSGRANSPPESESEKGSGRAVSIPEAESENGSGRAVSIPEAESENGSGRANSPPESESENGSGRAVSASQSEAENIPPWLPLPDAKQDELNHHHDALEKTTAAPHVLTDAPLNALTQEEKLLSCVNHVANWSQALREIPFHSNELTLLENCLPYQWDSSILSLYYGEDAEIFNTEKTRTAAVTGLSGWLGKSCDIAFMFKKNIETPRIFRARKTQQDQQEAEKNFLSHQYVTAAKAVFNNDMVIKSIEPLQEE